MHFTCEISKQMTADVVVVGGGTAGVFAAISAAKSGCKTVLIEKNSMLGGTMTAAGVNFPGLFFAWGKQIISGPCWESIERTVALGGATLPHISFHPKHHWHEQIKLNPFVYTTVLFQMCEEAGVHVICNAMISYASEEQNGVRCVVTTKDGLVAIRASVAIDATGDATLCQLVGFDMLKSQTQQPATLQNHISGYVAHEEIFERVKQSFAPTKLPSHITADDLIGYLKRNKINMHVACVDADTAEGRTQLEKNALYEMMKVVCFLKEIEGLEKLTVDSIALETGVRETKRIVGKHIVTAEEYINGYTYPDSVCYAFYPIDLHVEKGIEQRFHEENVVSKVPYRALIPQKSHRILCAGRCVSSDTYANSALRVEAVCMATGQVSGAAASVMIREGVDAADITYQALCTTLHSMGAIVPNEVL
ncbi:MAG: FAD-dependent oxidoreductase [Clostridia bacterium]|nr:FAD-dependent oxidoreductase [Clostridia bacterium]